MFRRPPRSTRTDTRFPYTTLFRADEMQLDVGAIVGGERRAQECAAFGDVAGARPPAAAQEVVEGQLQFAGTVVASAPCLVLQGAYVEVVLQVGADPGAVGHDRAAVSTQLRFRRSEERRVGNECVSTSNSRWSQ